jgi:Ca2+-binding RTX toxin-like protein
MTVSSSPKVLAAVIKCDPIPASCDGTNDNDVMKGSNGNDQMIGNGGDDNMKGGAGNDYLEARQNNDHLDGGPGNDLLLGDDEDGAAGVYGADVINGGAGDDKLFQSQYIESHGGEPVKSDGFKDTLDCGAGNDEAWINVNTDHDTVKNCETVHTESD